MSSLRSIPVQNQVPVTQLYRKLEIVGKGAYGAVYRGVHIPTGDIVALKIINLDTPDDDVDDIQREVALLSQLRGPGTNNITKYYGCYLDGPHVWIVMDYASGGSVRTLMKATKGNVIEERYSVIIMRELLGALVYVHKSGVIHRDIKAANVLVTDQGRVLLCDFGVSALLSTAHAKRTTFVGTPYWMAPEVITSGSMYDSKADIWSLGITLYEMTTGAPPHSNQVEMKVLSLIPSTKPPRLAEHEGCKDMRDFVALCLKEVPGERASAEELTKAKWIKSAAKTPVSVLKELVVQYEAWSRAGGVRKSLVEEDEDDDSLRSNNRESTWEFDTLRGGSSIDFKALAEEINGNGSVSNDPPPPQQQQRMPPRSLRMLFEGTDHPNGGSDPFGLIARSRMITPAPGPAPGPTSTPVPIPASSGLPSPTHQAKDADKTVKQSAPTMSSTPPSTKSPPPLLPPAFPYIEPSSPQNSNSNESRPSSRSRSSSSARTNSSSSSQASPARGSDPATARQATFAFPPLPPVSTSTSKSTNLVSSSSSSSSSLSSSSQLALPSLNTNILSSSDDEGIGIRPRSARTPTYREVRQNRGLPDISIPPNLNKSKAPSTSGSPTSSSSPTRSIPPPFPAVPPSSTVRNDSIASGSSTSTIRRVRKVATASPVNFQFPASSRPRVGSQPEQQPQSVIAAASSSHSPSPSLSSPSFSRQLQLPLTFSDEPDVGSGPTLLRTTSPTGDTLTSSPTTHSWDDSVISSPGTIRHRTSLIMPLPPFSRAHSATPAGGRRFTTTTTKGAALSRGPSLNRQGSVAVMETVPTTTTTTPTTTPMASSSLQPPSSLRGRNRSESASAAGYRSEGDVGNGGLKTPVPALRDVLKLSPFPMDLVRGPDLLPPSPSVHVPLNRFPTRLHHPPIPLHIVTASSSTFDQSTTPPSVVESTSSDTFKASAPPLPSAIAPPVNRPLDLLKFATSPAETHAELARTVDDLAKWLTIVETGLANVLENSLLDGGATTVIQENSEEEEDSSAVSADMAH